MGQCGKFGSILFLALAFLLISSTFAFATTIYVKTDGNNSNDGLSWDTAKQTIQAGLDTAVSGNETWVAGGTYVERITLKSGVKLYGGYSGVGTTRDIALYVTTIDGNNGGSVVTGPSSATSTTIIDGFTIRNGSAVFGGGIYCDSSSPTISNNTITGNSASNGGGISCWDYSSPTIMNNRITDNIASSGGAISWSSSSPTITGNTIAGNTAFNYGGGISWSSCFPTITNTTYYGGVYRESSVTFTGNTIAGNTASQCDCGIYCYSAFLAIVNNTITGNGASRGGGISWSSSSSPTISNNIVAFNSHGIYASKGTLTLRNNCVYGNTDYNYSGISAGKADISADPLLVNRAGGDYHLRITSPCIGSGNNAHVIAGAVDMDGEPRILPAGGTVDIGTDEYSAHPMWLAGEAKRLVADGQEVYLTCRGGTVVIAKLADLGAFYVESPDRSSGLQCRAGTLLDVGQCGIIHGTMATIDGERVLTDASPVPESLSTTKVPAPLSITNRDLGGGNWFYDPRQAKGQQGVKDYPEDGWLPAYSAALNNIGLLVTIWGNVTYSGTDYFYIDDGSVLDDGSGHIGVKVSAPGLSIPSSGFVWVTGISSCEKKGDDLVRLIRATHIVPVQ